MGSLVLDFKARRQRISLTALIDVVFILLLFFMLTSSFSQWRGLNLQWPVAVEQKQDPKPQFLLLQRDGAISLIDGELSLSHYQQLAAIHGPSFAAERPVIVVPEADAQLQDVVALLDVLRAVSGLPVSYGGAVENGFPD